MKVLEKHIKINFLDNLLSLMSDKTVLKYFQSNLKLQFLKLNFYPILGSNPKNFPFKVAKFDQ